MGFDGTFFGAGRKKVDEWLERYFSALRSRPVRSRASPGEVSKHLPVEAPKQGESFESIMTDFQRLAEIGVTHWNHPRFFAYFPCSTAPIALLADQLCSALSQQGMLWQTSPFSTELESRMIRWMVVLLGLDPSSFDGVINDTASTSTLSAILMARERVTQFGARDQGLQGFPALRLYVSPEAHSSIKKAAWLAGIGAENVVEISTNSADQMDVRHLRDQIELDRGAGRLPMMVVGAAGGTSVGAFDDLHALADVADQENLFLHIDAAWAGVAAIHEDFRQLFSGWERADSIVLNPHKWLMTGMDCSVFLLRDPELLTKTMSIMPSFLHTHREEELLNYSEWTPQLGRSFRSLKLWFVLRHYGSAGLAKILQDHVEWARCLCERLRQIDGFEIVTEPSLSLFSFALATDEATISLLKQVNDDGRIYLTPTTYKGRTAIRFVAGTASCTRDDVEMAGDVLEELLRLNQN